AVSITYTTGGVRSAMAHQRKPTRHLGNRPPQAPSWLMREYASSPCGGGVPLVRAMTVEDTRHVVRAYHNAYCRGDVLPPDSPEARELAARWDDIHVRARSLFQGNEKLWHSVGRAHLDGQYDHIDEAGHAEDYAFIRE